MTRRNWNLPKARDDEVRIVEKTLDFGIVPKVMRVFEPKNKLISKEQRERAERDYERRRQAMNEYGLVLEPEQPDEAFEALSDVMGDRVFTEEEAVEVIRDVNDVSRQTAYRRFENLVRNGNIRELV